MQILNILLNEFCLSHEIQTEKLQKLKQKTDEHEN